TQVFNVNMAGGNAFVEVDFRQLTGPAYLNISWSYLQPGPIPTTSPATCQPAATSVPSLENMYGNFTPCIQQNLHQDQCFNASGDWNSPNLGSIQMEPKIVVWGAAPLTRRAIWSFRRAANLSPSSAANPKRAGIPSSFSKTRTDDQSVSLVIRPQSIYNPL